MNTVTDTASPCGLIFRHVASTGGTYGVGRFVKEWAGALVFLLITVSGGNAAHAQEFNATVLGAVARPGAYAFQKGDRLSSLIERAGGYADNAFLRGAALTRDSARARNRKALDNAISLLEERAFAAPGDEDRMREFFDGLKKLPPVTRLPIRLAHPRLLKGTEDDLPLEDGDSLTIPPWTDKITVTGAVKNGGSRIELPFGAKTRLEDYLRMAGGLTGDADPDHAYLIKADGTAAPLARGLVRWSPERSRWEIPALVEGGPSIEPGDTIVVPGKPARSSRARGIRDLPRLLMEIHALTGVRADPP